MAQHKERVHYDKFSVLITPAGYQNLRVYNIDDGRVWRFEVTLAARQTDGAQRATFKRMGLFYREGGNVQIHGPTWHATDTFKSDTNMDIRYVLGPTTITVQVKNAAAVSTRWNGHTDIITVK